MSSAWPSWLKVDGGGGTQGQGADILLRKGTLFQCEGRKALTAILKPIDLHCLRSVNPGQVTLASLAEFGVQKRGLRTLRPSHSSPGTHGSPGVPCGTTPTRSHHKQLHQACHKDRQPGQHGRP